MGTTSTRTVDARGRLTLGAEFAGHQVIVQKVDEGELRIIQAETVPAREAWLYKNPEALASVMQGLAEARAGETAKAPDLDAAIARFKNKDD